MARTIIDHVNFDDDMILEHKTKESFIKAYSGHWHLFSDEHLSKAYDIIKGKYAEVISETPKAKKK